MEYEKKDTNEDKRKGCQLKNSMAKESAPGATDQGKKKETKVEERNTKKQKTKFEQRAETNTKKTPSKHKMSVGGKGEKARRKGSTKIKRKGRKRKPQKKRE